MFGKNLLENFSLYLLGHLRAKNQRSEKYLSLIRNFKGVKFNRLRKFHQIIFPFTYYRSWQGAFWLIFEKIFLLLSSTVRRSKMPTIGENIFGHKKCALGFLKNESAGLLRYSIVGAERSCRLFKSEIFFEHFSVPLSSFAFTRMPTSMRY